MPNHKKPTALHLLNGNPGHRPLNLDEPEFIQGDAQPPEEVQQDAFALQEWQRRAPELTDLGLLRGQYATEFGEYCLQHALIKRLRSAMSKLDIDEAIAKGYLKHLQLASSRDCESRPGSVLLRRMLRGLGLLLKPSRRARKNSCREKLLVLNFDTLDCLRFAYALTLIKSKDGRNRLLARLAEIFKASLDIRTGKTSAQGQPPDIDFADLDHGELREASVHFACLQRAFAEAGHKSSAEFCHSIV